jgi:IclR family transcriptional regulator, acetate operon repressor
MSKKSDSSSAALRAFGILETVARSDRPIAMSDVVEAHGLPKATVFRLLSLLEDAGLVLREPRAKSYTAGPRLTRLALDVMLNSSVRLVRHGILQRVADETGETCNLTMVDGTEVMYIDRVESQSPLRIDLKPGSRVPLHCTASGKLFLSQLPRAKRRTILQSIALKRLTAHTITHPDLLEAELDRIRASRVSLDNEEYLDGLVCVAVPVMDGSGRDIASLAIQAPIARMTLARAMEHVPMLRTAAAAIAATFDPSAFEDKAAVAPSPGPRTTKRGASEQPEWA